MSVETANGEVSKPVISVRNLSKTYVHGMVFRKKFPALRDVSLEVGQSEIFGLLGPNGAGKTTFLKILLGVIRKSAGAATMLGFQAGSRRGRRHVGYLPEQLRMPRHLTGFTAMDYYGRLNGLGSREIRARRDELLEFVGLAGRGADRITRYSKGMLQRLGLAQALLHDPRLLVLDEPTDGLDPGARAEMRSLMIQLRNRGVTVFLNSHLLGEVEMVCDRVAILDQGNLRYCGPVREIGALVHDGGESGNQYQLEVVGSESDVRSALHGEGPPEIQIVQCESHGDQVRVVAVLADPSVVDAAVDRLRSAGLSLLELRRQATSLEDAFLKITGTGGEPDSSSPPAPPT